MVVVEVPGDGAFVAVLVCDAVLELVVDVLVTVVVVVVGCVEVVELVLVDEEDFVADAQSLAASCSTVWAPSPRFCTSLVLTDGGRLPTAVLKALAAVVAAEQSPELTAFETASSRLESVLP
ncbi:MAG TPA: hypothetical protein VHW04_12710 [Solirubrobacteraceae bacterium]|nr:hypothetical protein [Solirubrobacteraceae bacterium]